MPDGFRQFHIHGTNTMKIKVFRNGNSASMEKNGCWYVVKCRIGTELHDRVMVDDPRMARGYYKAFCAVAKNK